MPNRQKSLNVATDLLKRQLEREKFGYLPAAKDAVEMARERLANAERELKACQERIEVIEDTIFRLMPPTTEVSQ